MSCGTYIQIIQGDSYAFTSDVLLNNVEQNVAGADVSFFALANVDLGGPTEIINVNTASGQIAISGNNNSRITVTLNSDFTANIAQANVGSWFLRTETSGGEVYTLDRGRICVVPGFGPIPI